MTENSLLFLGGKWDRIAEITWSQKTHAIQVVEMFIKNFQALGSKLGSCASVGRVLADTIGYMATDTRPIYRPMCRPRLGRHINRHQPISMPADTWPILHRHSAATWPILYEHSANTTLTWSVLAWPLTPAIFMSFFQPCFSSSSLLYMTLVTFGSSSIWGLLLSEVRYFRGEKVDIKSWYDYALFLPHGWVFQF